MSAEPISTRIARLKGCEPVSDGAGGWQCHCALNKHGDWCARCSDRHEYINEAWLTPAASFALLAEMVEGEDDPRICCDLAAHHEEPHQRYWIEWPDNRVETFASPTLGEAIALAYEAYATAKAVRQ